MLIIYQFINTFPTGIKQELSWEITPSSSIFCLVFFIKSFRFLVPCYYLNFSHKGSVWWQIIHFIILTNNPPCLVPIMVDIFTLKVYTVPCINYWTSLTQTLQYYLDQQIIQNLLDISCRECCIWQCLWMSVCAMIGGKKLSWMKAHQTRL